jgi:hypothetical protein
MLPEHPFDRVDAVPEAQKTRDVLASEEEHPR